MLPAKVIFRRPLKDPAEEIDGEHDQDDDKENSDDGQIDSLVGCGSLAGKAQVEEDLNGG
jgi:hypothetical protein